MKTLRQKMIDTMNDHGFAERTHRSYLGAIAQLAKYYHQPPDQLTIDQLQSYFLYLIKDKKLSPSTCRLTLNAIRFLYIKVLKREHFILSIVTPKNPQRIPELLSSDDITQIFRACKNQKHYTLLMLCYGCGLRVSELVNLKIKDIQSQQYLLRIEQGKGGKDRLVFLSEYLLNYLRQYWQYIPSFPLVISKS